MRIFRPVLQSDLHELRYELEITYTDQVESYQCSYYYDNFMAVLNMLNMMNLNGLLTNPHVVYTVHYTATLRN